jgi:hypothetical protein
VPPEPHADRVSAEAAATAVSRTARLRFEHRGARLAAGM